MQISSRFTLAIHIFACVDIFKNDYKVTSDFISKSTNVNPVIIRKILLQLRNAGLIEVARGTGGTTITGRFQRLHFWISTGQWNVWRITHYSIFTKIQMKNVR